MSMQKMDALEQKPSLSELEVQNMADRIVEEILKLNRPSISESEIEQMVECELQRVCG